MPQVPSSYRTVSFHQGFTPEVGAVPFPGYRLIRLRGRGGFADVWESTSPAGLRVALKFMPAANAGTTARELRSLQTVRGLSHPHLLPIRQVWSLPGCIVIAMDLAEASLQDLFELYLEELKQLIELPKLGLYLHQVAESLDFLNLRKHRIDGRLVSLQHGDIKPSNILLLNDQAMLADYGLATPISVSSMPCARQGTAEYCAPEIFQGTLSERSDQFSFAVMYFLMRTAQFPYPPPPGPGERLKNYVRPEPELSALPAEERPIVAKALHPIPQNRYASCQEFMTAILRVNKLQIAYDEAGKAQLVPVLLESQSVTKSQLYRLRSTGSD